MSATMKYAVLRMAVLVALLFAVGLATAGPAEATEQLIAEKEVFVPESRSSVDTALTIQPGDRLEISASEQIWAGVWLTGWNGPQGWDWTDCNNKFPLPCVHPYSLLGKLNGSYFEIGRGINKVHTGPQSRLYLRVNDDVVNNGDGDFLVHIQVYRNLP